MPYLPFLSYEILTHEFPFTTTESWVNAFSSYSVWKFTVQPCDVGDHSGRNPGSHV